MILNKEQIEAVKDGIITSMKNVYIDMGSLPGDAFLVSATAVADKIIENVQETLKPKKAKK